MRENDLLLALSDRYQGGRLPLFTKTYIKKLSEDEIFASINECYNSFPNELRQPLDDFTKEHIESNWMNSSIIDADLGDVFDEAIQCIFDFLGDRMAVVRDEDVITVYQLMFCRFALIAKMSKEFRKAIGIKIGFFS